MKLIIFAGGKGTRLWPLSRVNSPKQFDKIFNNKSTLRLAFQRLETAFDKADIFIQTIDRYKDAVKEQIPELADENILIEPAKKDLGPAVCFCANEFKKRGYNGAIAILWADHLMERVDAFINALKTGEELISEDADRFIFLGERARFANNNLGWIKMGGVRKVVNKLDVCSFEGWKYKPEQGECDKMHKGGFYAWNPGYIITSVSFLLDNYRRFAPEIFEKINSGDYDTMPSVHFDKAIAENIDIKKAVVLKTDMGWSDPGTLYALKEALEETRKANVVLGKVSMLDCEDSLVYNLEAGKLVSTIGLSGMVVVNTPDALLVVPKEEVVNITKLVKQMEAEGLEDYL